MARLGRRRAARALLHELSSRSQPPPISLVLNNAHSESEAVTVEVFARSTAELIKAARHHGKSTFGKGAWDDFVVLSFVDPETGETRNILRATRISDVHAAGAAFAIASARRKKSHGMPWNKGHKVQDDEAGVSMVAFDAAQENVEIDRAGAGRIQQKSGCGVESVSITMNGHLPGGGGARYKGQVKDPTLDFEID